MQSTRLLLKVNDRSSIEDVPTSLDGRLGHWILAAERQIECLPRSTESSRRSPSMRQAVRRSHEQIFKILGFTKVGPTC